MPRFFMAGTNILGGMAIMKGRDAEHVRVLRLRPGEDMIICDGKGTDYKCRLVKADKEQVEAEVIEVVPCPAEPTVQVTVLCGLPKGDKTDYIIQKCVEAGASEIMFFQSDRCVAKPDKPEKKLERWQRIAEEAAKQSVTMDRNGDIWFQGQKVGANEVAALLKPFVEADKSLAVHVAIHNSLSHKEFNPLIQAVSESGAKLILTGQPDD